MSDPEGDVLNSYIEMGAKWERAAIVAWLRGRPSGYYGGARVASEIENGVHLAGDDE